MRSTQAEINIDNNSPVIVYERETRDIRAFDCKGDRPLIQALNKLPRTTSNFCDLVVFAEDGGIERLLGIIQECGYKQSEAEKLSPHDLIKFEALKAWKWQLSLLNLAIAAYCGNEAIRRRLFDGGIMPIILTILDNYLKTLQDCKLAATGKLRQLIVKILCNF